MFLTPEQRALRGRIGGFARAANYPPDSLTAPARAAFVNRFVEAVDSEFPGLPEGERQRRAQAKLQEHMAKLSLAGAKARRRKAGK